MARLSMVMIGLVLVLVLPASAQTEREKSCEITAQIVSIAVQDRLAGRSADAIKAALSREGSGVTGVYVATIDPLVDMVFALNQAGLNDQAVKTYRQQCLNF